MDTMNQTTTILFSGMAIIAITLATERILSTLII